MDHYDNTLATLDTDVRMYVNITSLSSSYGRCPTRLLTNTIPVVVTALLL